MQIEVRLWIGLIASLSIGLLAYWRRSLTTSGVLGAVIVGTTILGFGGWAAGWSLVVFFVSSSVLSHFKETNTRKQRAAEMFEKGGQRDLWQALANGGAAALFAVLDYFTYQGYPCSLGMDCVEMPTLLQMALLGALATVTADTWATELGVLSKSKPISITSLQHVEPGTSGGISLTGIVAALMGAGFIGLLYGFSSGETMFGGMFRNFGPIFRIVLVLLCGGLLGSLFDSFLGATVQAMYYSEARQKETEKPYERDGTPNRPLRGWHWMTNDWVNFISSVFGALVAAGLAQVLFMLP